MEINQCEAVLKASPDHDTDQDRLLRQFSFHPDSREGCPKHEEQSFLNPIR